MKGRELDVRFAEGDRKKPGQMVRKETTSRRNSSSDRRRSDSPRRRRSSPQPHRSMNRRNSPPSNRNSHRDHSPLLRQGNRSPLRQRSPIIRQRSPPQQRSPTRGGSPVRNRLTVGLDPARSPPPRRRIPVRRSSPGPVRNRSPPGKEHIVRRQRSPAPHNRPQRRVRSPAPLIESPPQHSDHALRRSPRNRSPIHRTSRRSPSPGLRPNVNRSKHSMREELIISSRRSASPPRVRHHTSPLTNHRITVSTDNKDDRTIGSSRQGGRVRARDDRMNERRDERNLDDGRQSRYDGLRRTQGSFDQSPPRKRPIRRSPMQANHSTAPPDRSRFSPDVPKGRVSSRPRGRSPKGGRDVMRGRSPQARVLLETPEIPVHHERTHSPRSHKMSDRRREDHANRSRRRQSDSRRNNEEDFEFVDEEEYYEELDAMDDMDNLDIDFN